MNVVHVSFPGLGIHDLPIDNIAFTFNLGGNEFNIYWYGIIVAFSFLLCLLLASRQAPKFGIKQDDIIDTFLWIIILGLVGARLYYVLFSWDDFKDDLLKIFQTREGGLAFYGGLIGGILALLISAKIKKINLMRYMDFFAVYVPLGQGIGRWANFVNQEAFGTNTDLPWGMFSEKTYLHLSQLGDGYAPLSPVHPTFLYEFLANMVIFVILYKARKKSENHGKITGLYLILYGLVRFFVEGLRTDSLYVGHTTIRISQLLSLVFVIVGLVFYYLSTKKVFGSHELVAEAETSDEVLANTTETNETSSSDEKQKESAELTESSEEKSEEADSETADNFTEKSDSK